MHILQINKFYHIVGGVDRYYLDLGKLLKKKGHKVAYFSMDHPRNQKTKWSKYFVSNASFNKPYLGQGFKLFLRMLYSREARRQIAGLLDDFRPDIAHIHHIYHQISPSILLELKKRKIPIVHTVGDYHLISPHHNNLFHRDHICEVSKPHRYYKTVIHKCIKNSYLASLAEAVEQYFHYYLKIYIKNIDLFISPSKFMTGKLIEYGLPQERIRTLPYFTDYLSSPMSKEEGKYILYFGRLSEEKGLRFLVDNVGKLPDIRLIIAGEGPLGFELKKTIAKNKYINIEIKEKFIPEIELKKLIQGCRFVVFPSQSYETFGISLLEAYASGKPVLASRIGALPEIVKNNITGYLFESGNPDDFTKKLIKLWLSFNLRQNMGMSGRRLTELEFNPDIHYERLLNVFSQL